MTMVPLQASFKNSDALVYRLLQVIGDPQNIQPTHQPTQSTNSPVNGSNELPRDWTSTRPMSFSYPFGPSTGV